jgi:hypothetical protein
MSDFQAMGKPLIIDLFLGLKATTPHAADKLLERWVRRASDYVSGITAYKLSHAIMGSC